MECFFVAFVLFEDVREDGDPSGKRYRYGWGNPAVATLLNLDLVVHEAKGDKPWIIRQIEVLTTYESREVYALWLNYISKAPWWGKLVNGERIDIADRLITWVVKQSAPPREGWLSGPNEELHPQDILQEVGYKTVSGVSHGT